jgi:hypothetical protein
LKEYQILIHSLYTKPTPVYLILNQTLGAARHQLRRERQHHPVIYNL